MTIEDWVRNLHRLTADLESLIPGKQTPSADDAAILHFVVLQLDDLRRHLAERYGEAKDDGLMLRAIRKTFERQP